jgi:AcrR family transcriptional regulator
MPGSPAKYYSMLKKTQSNRRAQILDAAAALYSEKGYQATGVRELAETVGIEPASIYSHFGSKESLLWEIAIACADDFQHSVQPIASSGEPPQERLRAMITEHVKVTLRNQNAAAVFTHEWQHLGEKRNAQYAHRRQEYEQMFRDVIQEGIDLGIFQHYSNKFITLTILSALNFTYKWYRPEGNMTPSEIGEGVASILLDGLIIPQN